ncbi:hypothetical protein ETB97_004267, partial [Aspergillus alliaceus]
METDLSLSVNEAEIWSLHNSWMDLNPFNLEFIRGEEEVASGNGTQTLAVLLGLLWSDVVLISVILLVLVILFILLIVLIVLFFVALRFFFCPSSSSTSSLLCSPSTPKLAPSVRGP